MRAALVILACLFVSGCSSTPLYDGVAQVVETGDAPRERVIEAAREVLGKAGYELERVDVSRGVLTTRAKPSIGAALVGRGEHMGRRALAEAVNEHEHRVRVDVDDAGVVRLRVFVYRIGTPGRRVDTESLRLSTRSSIIGPDGSALPSVISTPIGQDEALARRLADRIGRSLDRG